MDYEEAGYMGPGHVSARASIIAAGAISTGYGRCPREKNDEPPRPLWTPSKLEYAIAHHSKTMRIQEAGKELLELVLTDDQHDYYSFL